MQLISEAIASGVLEDISKNSIESEPEKRRYLVADEIGIDRPLNRKQRRALKAIERKKPKAKKTA